MNVLVTGGVGFIGTNLIKRLLKDGHNVVSLDNYSNGTEENEQEGCVYHQVDIRDCLDFDFFMDDVDIIYHMAALPRIQPSFTEPEITFETNVLGTMNIMSWANEKKCPVIYAGSSSSHGDLFANPYTFSKYQGEEMVKMWNKIYGVKSAICRFYNVYGPHQLQDGAYATVIGIFEKQYEEGRELTITGDGEQRRDFTHVDDIVDGIIKCGEQIDKSNGRTFELGRGENFSINVVAQSFDAGYTYIPARPGEMRETLCTDTTANELLDWEPKIDLLDYIEERRNVIKRVSS